MAYTLSFDASMKFTGNSWKGFLDHFLREDDETKNHSNEMIDPTKTNNNSTLVYDAEKEKMVITKNADEIVNAINTRLADAIDLQTNTYKTNGKKVRSDAVMVRGLVIQLDPEFYQDCIESRNIKAMSQSCNDLLHLLQDQYGKKNIVAASLHRDETNPHLHVLMTPVTEDKRLSQKDFFDKVKLKEAHRSMREALINKGYDIDLQRKTPKGSRRLTEQQYKDMAEAQKKQKQLNDLEISLKHRKQAVDDEKQQLDDEKAEFASYKAEMAAKLQEQQKQITEANKASEQLYDDAQQLYDEALQIHKKLLNRDDLYLQHNYAQDLGHVKQQLDQFSF